jgi:GT2 family glycosyltransferase
LLEILPVGVLPRTVAVLMTTHGNSKNCESSVMALDVACKSAGLTSTIFLANSGSKLSLSFAGSEFVKVIEFGTSNSTFWASGMRLAWERCANDDQDFDLVLWINDDTRIKEQGLSVLLKNLIDGGPSSISVGACEDSQGNLTYGGYSQRSLLLPLHFERVPQRGDRQLCATFNGNIVLLRMSAFHKLGGFPRGFTHLRADIHFGLSAKRKGFRSFLAPGVVGHCESNEGYLSYSSTKGKKIREKLSFLNSAKFGPLNEHVRFSLSHGGPMGIFYAFAPILRVLLSK